MTEKISLFGAGFIGGKFAETYPDEVEVMPRDAEFTTNPHILYGISTIHNYHPKDGNPFIDIETNLLKFVRVLDKSITDGSVFNLISTWFVYGEVPLPAQEDARCLPTGFYSITALAREQLLKSYCETFGLKYRILRLGNVIGIGDKKISPRKNALQWMVKELAQGREVKLYKGDPIRDFIDVRDCVKAIHLVLEKGELNTIYNISNGEGLRISTLLEVANRAGGYKGKIGEMEVPDFHSKVQTSKMWMDTRKLKSLGYVKSHDIETSVEELVHYYQLRQEHDEQG